MPPPIKCTDAPYPDASHVVSASQHDVSGCPLEDTALRHGVSAFFAAAALLQSTEAEAEEAKAACVGHDIAASQRRHAHGDQQKPFFCGIGGEGVARMTSRRKAVN